MGDIPVRHGNSKWRNRVDDTRPTYDSWKNMYHRCMNVNTPDYRYYGARGIKICKRWLNDYDAFVEDMGLRDEGMTLDRIDNQGHYEPGNCRWATRKEQSRNKRNNHILTIDGRSQTIADWADESGIACRALWIRVQAGYTGRDLLRPLKALQDCGSRGKYRRGCRCEACIEANRAYKRSQYRKTT